MKRFLLVCIVLLGTGCIHEVPAWQRSALQSRCMQDPLDPLEASFDAHVHATREGTLGATSGGGSACGCN